MRSAQLLRQYVKLVVETVVGSKPPFQLTSPPVPPKGRPNTGEFTLYREFPMVPTPEMMQFMKLDETDLDEDGLLWGEHEVGIDFDMYYEKPERQTMSYPGNPGGYSVDDWTVVSLNGMTLSPQDARALQDYLGELTDDETEALIEKYEDDHLPDYDPDPGW